MYTYVLSQEKQYLSYYDLMLKFSLPQNDQDFWAYIKFVAKLPKQ